MPTDIPALIERLNDAAETGKDLWGEDDPGYTLLDDAATALAEQAEEIGRLTRQRDLAARAIHDDIDYENEVEVEAAALRRQLAEAQEVVDGLLDGLDANCDERCGLTNAGWEKRIARARQWLASTEKS